MKSEARTLYLLKNLIREMAREIGLPKKKIIKESRFKIDPEKIAGYSGNFVEDNGLGEIDPSKYYQDAVQDVIATPPAQRNLKKQFSKYFKFLEEFYTSFTAHETKINDPLAHDVILSLAKEYSESALEKISRLNANVSLAERNQLFTVKIPRIIKDEFVSEDSYIILNKILYQRFSLFVGSLNGVIANNPELTEGSPVVFKEQSKILSKRLIRLNYTGVLNPDVTGEVLLEKMRESEPSMVFSKEDASSSGKYDTWKVQMSEDAVEFFVIFAIKKETGRKTSNNPLMTGKLLGFGAEYATAFAIENYDKTNVEKEMPDVLVSDNRLSTDAGRASLQHQKDFIDKIATMTETVKTKFNEFFQDAKVTKSPTSDNAKYDVEAEGIDKFNRKPSNIKIHVKYKSDRLIGIQLPEKIKKSTKKSNAPPPPQGQPDSSTIYKTTRDAFLFKNGPPSLDNNGFLDNSKGNLNGFGLRVLAKQTSARVTAESEISVIMKDASLRDVFLEDLEYVGFLDVLKNDIKTRLDLGGGNSNDVTAFINFKTPNEVDMHVFRQANIQDFTFTRGKTAGKAYLANAVLASGEEVKNVFAVELGSIARKKYVQIHKGDGYENFLAKIGARDTSPPSAPR